MYSHRSIRCSVFGAASFKDDFLQIYVFPDTNFGTNRVFWEGALKSDFVPFATVVPRIY
jgi:hypothetical protein